MPAQRRPRKSVGAGVRTSGNSPRSGRAGDPGAAPPGSPDIRPSTSPAPFFNSRGPRGLCSPPSLTATPRPLLLGHPALPPCRLCSALPADSYCASLSTLGDSVIRPHVLWGFTPAFLEDVWALICAPGTKGQKSQQGAPVHDLPGANTLGPPGDFSQPGEGYSSSFFRRATA